MAVTTPSTVVVSTRELAYTHTHTQAQTHTRALAQNQGSSRKKPFFDWRCH